MNETLNIVTIVVIISFVLYFFSNAMNTAEGFATDAKCTYDTPAVQEAMNDYPYFKMFKSQIAVPKICDACVKGEECNCIQSTENPFYPPCRINKNKLCPTPLQAQDYDEINSRNSTAMRCDYREKGKQYAPPDVYNTLSPETMLKDEQRKLNDDIAYNNINNFATFNNMIQQDSNKIETYADKIAEIRTSGNETQGFKKYGDTIAEIYDALVTPDANRYKKPLLPVSGMATCR
jgi:hypothetical protein